MIKLSFKLQASRANHSTPPTRQRRALAIHSSTSLTLRSASSVQSLATQRTYPDTPLSSHIRMFAVHIREYEHNYPNFCIRVSTGSTEKCETDRGFKDSPSSSQPLALFKAQVSAVPPESRRARTHQDASSDRVFGARAQPRCQARPSSRLATNIFSTIIPSSSSSLDIFRLQILQKEKTDPTTKRANESSAYISQQAAESEW